MITAPFMRELTFTMPNVVGILLLGIFQLGLSYVIYSKAIRHVTALEAVLIPIVEPLLNPIWVMLLQKEVPTLYAIIGGSIVLIGVTVRAISPKKKIIEAQVSVEG